MKAAAIYARKSNTQDGLDEREKSVARQIEHAREYAAKQGWTVADEHVFSDDGISGVEFEDCSILESGEDLVTRMQLYQRVTR